MVYTGENILVVGLPYCTLRQTFNCGTQSAGRSKQTADRSKQTADKKSNHKAAQEVNK